MMFEDVIHIDRTFDLASLLPEELLNAGPACLVQVYRVNRRLGCSRLNPKHLQLVAVIPREMATCGLSRHVPVDIVRVCEFSVADGERFQAVVTGRKIELTHETIRAVSVGKTQHISRAIV